MLLFGACVSVLVLSVRPCVVFHSCITQTVRCVYFIAHIPGYIPEYTRVYTRVYSAYILGVPGYIPEYIVHIFWGYPGIIPEYTRVQTTWLLGTRVPHHICPTLVPGTTQALDFFRFIYSRVCAQRQAVSGHTTSSSLLPRTTRSNYYIATDDDVQQELICIVPFGGSYSEPKGNSS